MHRKSFNVTYVHVFVQENSNLKAVVGEEHKEIVLKPQKQ